MSITTGNLEAIAYHLETKGETGLDPKAVAAQLRSAAAQLLDAGCFEEGLQEHIGDLLDAMRPFALFVKDTNGIVPSNANWHALAKAYEVAVRSLNLPGPARRAGEGADHPPVLRGRTNDGGSL